MNNSGYYKVYFKDNNLATDKSYSYSLDNWDYVCLHLMIEELEKYYGFKF